MELIDKDKVVAEIERRIKTNKECMLGLRNLDYYQGKVDALNDTLSFLDTLEVKEVYEHNDSDLDSILEEIGVEPDSKSAKMFKTAFYKSIDNYLEKKEK